MSDLLLIDLSSIAHPLYAVHGTAPNPDQPSIEILTKVRALSSGRPHVAICCDSGKSFRAEIDPTYKANRGPKEERAALYHQHDLAVEALRADGFPVWAVRGMEADDLICAAVKFATANQDPDSKDYHTVTVVSSDKDLFALISPRVSVKHAMNGAVADESVVLEKMGIKPSQVTDYLSLVGDASDNIKGADRIGPKTAAELLSVYPTLDFLFQCMDEGTAKLKPAVEKSLREFRPRMETVRSLVRMREDVEIPFADIFKPRVPKDAEAGFGMEDDLSDSHDAEMADLFDQPAAKSAAEPNPLRPAESTTTAPPDQPRATQAKAPTVEATAEPEKAPTQALEVFRGEPAPAPAEWTMQLEPRSMAEATKLAEWAFKSTFLGAYPNPQAALMVVLAGREIGMQAQASLRAFHIIEGTPRLPADVIRALVVRSGKAKFFRPVERTEKVSTWETQRADDDKVHRLSFTAEQGRVAFRGKGHQWTPKDEESWTKSGWGKNIEDMLVARSSSKLARMIYPEVVHGLFSIEEMSDAQ